MKPFKLSIVVCTFRRPELLSKCLRSLCAQTIYKQSYEVIVVDNDSTNSTQKIVASYRKQHPYIRYLREKQKGISHARTAGFDAARADIIASIDDDAQADSHWAERILHAFIQTNPTPAAVGGQILADFESQPPSWFATELESMHWGRHAHFLHGPQAQFGFYGSNMALHKTIWQEFRPFSKQFGMRAQIAGFGEEPELFMRIYQKQPYFWYDPAIKVYHWVPENKFTASYRFKRGYLSGRTKAKLENKNVWGTHRLIDWLNFIHWLSKTSAYISLKEKHKRTRAFKEIQTLGHWFGYLQGKTSKPAIRLKRD